jgi:hypothetical protein
MPQEPHMVDLLHEIWVETCDGMELESLCRAGPDGDGARKLLAPNARLIHTFAAGSYFEAMTLYHRYLDRPPYTTVHSMDHEPYPAEWLERQNSTKKIAARRSEQRHAVALR